MVLWEGFSKVGWVRTLKNHNGVNKVTGGRNSKGGESDGTNYDFKKRNKRVVYPVFERDWKILGERWWEV